MYFLVSFLVTTLLTLDFGYLAGIYLASIVTLGMYSFAFGILDSFTFCVMAKF